MSWWKEGVLYHIYPRSFKDSNGDGVGDLPGIIEKLDYLTWLGVEGIWLSPIFPSPMADFGYDVSDYCAVDPLFGSMSDFDKLIKAAHRRGIRVILDQVLNHTSDRHPWFQESRSSRNNPRADWYIWKDPSPEGSVPNNWISYFSGENEENAWRWDEKRRQFYLALFTAAQPDLNWNNMEVRKAVLEAMSFWLQRGVDGFRFDVAMSWCKDPSFRDIIPRRQKGKHAEYRAIDRYHLDPLVGRPETFMVFEEVREFLDRFQPERVGIGEVISEMGLYHYLEFSLPGRLHLVFHYDFIEDLSLDAQKLYRLISETEKFFDTRSWPCYAMGNHDVYRVLSRLGLSEKEERWPVGKLLATLQLTLRGTPVIYYGEEIGMENVSIPYERILDPLGKTWWPHRAGRDVVRTPMRWEEGHAAGFSTAEPWLPVHGETGERENVASQRDNPASLLHYYRRLIQTRKKTSALRRGSFRFLLDGHDGLLGFQRLDGSEKVAVILNFHSSQAGGDLEGSGKILCGTHRGEGESIEKRILLEPYEALIANVGDS